MTVIVWIAIVVMCLAIVYGLYDIVQEFRALKKRKNDDR